MGYQRFLNTLPEIHQEEMENRKEREKIVRPPLLSTWLTVLPLQLAEFNRERREKRERIRREAQVHGKCSPDSD